MSLLVAASDAKLGDAALPADQAVEVMPADSRSEAPWDARPAEPAPPDAVADSAPPDAATDSVPPDAATDSVPPDAVADSVPPDVVADSTAADQWPSSPLLFDLAGWTYHANGNNVPGHPQVTNTATTTLIPDNCYQAGAAVLSTLDPLPPFAVEFEFSIYDDDGGPVYNSADGIAFMFAKDRGAYGTPPSGSARGVISDGIGYAVHFSIWGTRQVILTDGLGTPLQTNASPTVASVYTDGQWQPVRVEVRSSSVQVLYDGVLIIDQAISVGTIHRAFGFGAGTGDADGEHRIRNVRLQPLP